MINLLFGASNVVTKTITVCTVSKSGLKLYMKVVKLVHLSYLTKQEKQNWAFNSIY